MELKKTKKTSLRSPKIKCPTHNKIKNPKMNKAKERRKNLRTKVKES